MTGTHIQALITHGSDRMNGHERGHLKDPFEQICADFLTQSQQAVLYLEAEVYLASK